MLQYKMIEIFSSEEVRWQGQPLYSAIVSYVNGLKIAARCIVTRGIEGSYENGEVAAGRLEVLSYNMPIRITIAAPVSKVDEMLARIMEMVSDGIVAVRDMDVISYRTRGRLIPRHIRVRDIMTRDPKKAGLTTPLDQVARLLLSSSFTGLPVVDEKNRPVGVIAQRDLIYKAGMPIRLGLLAQSNHEKLSTVLDALSSRQAMAVMTQPAVTIGMDKRVTEAVMVMLKEKVKRLPVIDSSGKLVGILSRIDVFHTITRESPNWEVLRSQHVRVEGARFVSDIMRRDISSVLPETPVDEVVGLIGCNDIQRVCVVDNNGIFLGLISDRDLLSAFSDQSPGIWDYFVSKISVIDRGRKHGDIEKRLHAKTAREVMNTRIVTIQEDAPIEQAIQLMLKRAIKRLPVIDTKGKFTGMISRDSLLREGFAS